MVNSYLDDGSLFNGLQSLKQWHDTFGDPSANEIGLMNSAGFLPGVVAGFVGDWTQLYIGKSWTIWLNTVFVVCSRLSTTKIPSLITMI